MFICVEHIFYIKIYIHIYQPVIKEQQEHRAADIFLLLPSSLQTALTFIFHSQSHNKEFPAV